MDDIQLAIAIRKDDEIAFQELFELYYQRILAYIFTLTHDHAASEDIVQQAFVTLWVQRQKLDIKKSPKNYLFAIARNIFTDRYRELKRQNEFLVELKANALSERIETDRELVEERIEKLKSIIESLPERCREIIRLNKIDGLKYKEIAEHLGISSKTVESQMRIAFQKIRKGFGEGDYLLFVLMKQMPLFGK